MLLWTLSRCVITWSKLPDHLQAAPGHGQPYGRYSQLSSWFSFKLGIMCRVHPWLEYLHGNMRDDATFSIPRLRMLPAKQMIIRTFPIFPINSFKYSSGQKSKNMIILLTKHSVVRKAFNAPLWSSRAVHQCPTGFQFLVLGSSAFFGQVIFSNIHW